MKFYKTNEVMRTKKVFYLSEMFVLNKNDALTKDVQNILRKHSVMLQKLSLALQISRYIIP